MMPDQDWTWVKNERIPSDTGEGRRVVSVLLARLEQEQWDESALFGVHLAFEEALVNAIKHGNKMDPSKSVHIKMQTSRTAVRIEIRDEGPGFVPEEVPDPTADENLEAPSGRGIMLMRNFMSRVEYCENGNHVVMEKQRP